MLVKSAVNDETLMELRLGGVLTLNPVECRELLDLLARSGIADQLVMRVGGSREWVRLASRWGTAVRYGITVGSVADDTKITRNKEKP